MKRVCLRRAFGEFTNQPRNDHSNTIYTNNWVACPRFAERPDKALSSGEWHSYLFNKLKGFALERIATERIAMRPKALVVFCAKALRAATGFVGKVVAAINGTWFGGKSHSETLLRSCLVRAHRDVTASGGFVASNTKMNLVEA